MDDRENVSEDYREDVIVNVEMILFALRSDLGRLEPLLLNFIKRAGFKEISEIVGELKEIGETCIRLSNEIILMSMCNELDKKV